MSLGEYAKHRGCSPAAVTIAIRDGRCPVELDGSGKKVVDSEKADEQWVSGGAGQPQGNKEKKQDEAKGNSPPLLHSRSIKEAFQARMAKLDYEDRIGITINAEEVKKEAFKSARIVRDNMLNIPDRLAAELAGETNQFVIHKKLTDEIRRAISDVLNTLNKQDENA